MSVDISKLAAASFMPGLQNAGQISGTAFINGVLNPSGTSTTSNLTGSFTLTLPDPTVISFISINLPDSHGDLASLWFPIIGTAELTDFTDQYRLVIFEQSSTVGRQFNLNFVSTSTGTNKTFANYRILFTGHLFTYPWNQ